MTPDAPTVHVVDDDASFLRAVARLLRASGYTVATFDSAASFLARPSADAPGCVVADLRMPGTSGLDLQDAMARRGDGTPIVFLTGDGSVPSSVRAMRGGAEDFLSKRAPTDELLDAVDRALARDARRRAERTRLEGLRAPFATLTPRDREVLEHVLRGRLNKQIAGVLGIDERSVKRHRTSIMTKLRVESVPELMDLVHAARPFDAEPGPAAPPPPSSAPRP